MNNHAIADQFNPPIPEITRERNKVVKKLLAVLGDAYHVESGCTKNRKGVLQYG